MPSVRGEKFSIGARNRLGEGRQDAREGDENVTLRGTPLGLSGESVAQDPSNAFLGSPTMKARVSGSTEFSKSRMNLS